MAIIVTNADAPELSVELRQQAYNVMDCCITGGIMEALRPKLEKDPEAAEVYEFERSMQGPAFTMALRGIAVDEGEAKGTVAKLMNAEAWAIVRLRQLAAVWLGEDAAGSTDVVEVVKGLRGKKPSPGMSPHSHVWVKKLFYGKLEDGGCEEKEYLKAKKKPSNAGGEESASTANEEALTMLQARSPIVGIMAHLVLKARELRKLRGFIAARRSSDGRLRSSFNVGATTSGRWSFSKNCFGEGLNFGNIPKGARTMFVPSTPSRILVNVDLKQAESYIVAQICDDMAYVAAHETGDAHGAVALDVFGYLMPPGADPEKWVRQPNPGVPRGESPRQACKKLGHGTNYGIGERKSSKLTGLPIKDIKAFRERFFGKYANVKKRIDEIESRLLSCNRFVSFLGRPHQHLGHPKDGETQRAALADEPQGAVADILNLVLWRLWSRHDVGCTTPRMWMLSQTYDSILFECEEGELEEVRKAVEDAFRVVVPINGRSVVVPHDFGWGKNWKAAC